MKTPAETRDILDKLEAQHPDADTELNHSNAFELLVATILSAQSTDARVNLVTPALFNRYPNVRHADPPRPADLQAEAAVRSVRRPGRLRFFRGHHERARARSNLTWNEKNSSGSSLTRLPQFPGGSAMR